MRKTYFTILPITAVVIFAWSFAACCSPVEKPLYFVWDNPAFTEIAAESVANNQLVEEYSTVESAYMRVVKYYNKDMGDRQALKIARLVLYYSDQFKLDPRLVVSVIVVESRFKPHAVSPKGAMGLGQLMPGTARSLGVKNAFDINQNIYGTTRYLRMMYERWQNNDKVLDLMLASYNAGPNAVEKHKGIPPYRETQKYVAKVKKLYRYFVYGS